MASWFRSLLALLLVRYLVGEDCPQIVSRDAWFANRPVRIQYLPRPVSLVIIQDTGTGVCFTGYKCQIMLRNIQSSHMSIDNADIPSSFYIGGDGIVYEGTGWLHVGSHTPAYDKISISISFIGNYNKVEPTQSQLHVARSLLACGVAGGHLQENYDLSGQNQLINRDSPGRHLFDIVKTWPEWNGA